MRTAVLIALCILVVGMLTATATALRSVSRIWLRRWAEHRLRGSESGELVLERPHRLVLSGVAISSAVIFLVGGALARFAEEGYADFAIATAITMVTLAALGHLLPRAIGRRWPTRIVPVLLPPLRLLDAIVGPIVAAAQRAVPRIAPPPRVTVPVQPRDALHELLEEGVLEGVGEPDEIAIITGVVEFAEKTVREVMTSRNAIFSVDYSLPPAEVARRIAASGYSRVPVYSGSPETFIGMVHAFDLLKSGAEGDLPLRPLAYTLPTRRCNELLGEMMRHSRHLVIVADVDGRTLGLVTLEDLLEELVGDIRDEHDEPETAASAPVA
jgi:magnesium and cobalt exporter, CNNM family